MSCGLVDLGCHVHQVIDPIWVWIQVGFWVVVALLALYVLGKINSIFGWRGVAAAIGAGALGFAALFGYRAGRNSVRDPEGDFDPPHRPKKKPAPVKPIFPSDSNDDPDGWLKNIFNGNKRR